MNTPIMAAGPHIHSKDSSRRIMLDVILALLPATVAGVILYGLPALWVILACVISAVAAEFLFNLCTRRAQTVGDLSKQYEGVRLGFDMAPIR